MWHEAQQIEGKSWESWQPGKEQESWELWGQSLEIARKSWEVWHEALEEEEEEEE